MGIEKLKTVLKNKNRSLTLKTPIISASGTYGYSDEYEDFIDLNCFGAISTKGITLEKRLGNDGDRIFEVKGGMINRIGLENVGIEKFIETKLPILRKKKIDFLLNIAGSTSQDYEKLALIAQKNNIEAIEVNVSCPNVKSGCLEFGLNPNSLYDLTSKIRKNYDGFLIVKLSPNTSDIKALATAVEEAGADCISAINTLRGLGIKLDWVGKKFIKKSVQGGLSGACIKPVALYMVNQIKEAVKIPIIAMGGIEKLQDLFEFISVGADAFQIGTANFINPSICSNLAKELNEFMIKNEIKDFEELKEVIKND
ncbi:MAG: dihydroorotate dehydrogenase [Candidatus Gastranaerophilales bacterium]|nr:dihydroorotate dehydrogenase [Candidatus Gastranaerophilales bacterium]